VAVELLISFNDVPKSNPALIDSDEITSLTAAEVSTFTGCPATGAVAVVAELKLDGRLSFNSSTGSNSGTHFSACPAGHSG